MKNPNKRWRAFLGCTMFVLVTGVVVQGNAQIFNLANGNSAVAISAGPVGGMTSYQVDGVNQVKHQWWYYRVAPVGFESPIETIGSLLPPQGSPNYLDLTYDSLSYSARVTYTLTGGAPGSGKSSLNEAITFLNKSATPLSLSFFDYSDFDLTGVAGGQSLQFGTSAIPTLRTNSFRQTLGANWLTTSLVSGTNFPSHVEAAFAFTTLNSLTDGGGTILSDAMSAGVGDVTGTFQWDVTLAAGQSLTISKLISMQVPEPSALGLLGLGLVATLYRRWRA